MYKKVYGFYQKQSTLVVLNIKGGNEMGILTFKGGVHPYDGKELSKNSPVVKYLPKGDMVYPLSQHIGAPAAAIVQKGDHVLAGQKIADAAGFVSSPIHSSVSGTVKGIEPRLTATGSMVNSIIIENDQQYESVEFTPARLEDLSKEEILVRIKEGGVVGMGGAGFPTQVKLAPKEPEKIDHILVNGAECEPYLTSDYRRMLDDSEKLIEGLRVMLKLFDNAKGYICIEDNKPDCIAKLKEMVKDIPRIEVAELMTKYPQGGERFLIKAVTDREINSAMLPADAGCVVDNVDTVIAVYEAVILGKPVMDRIVTVTGQGIKNPQNFDVLSGTDMAELIEAAGGLTDNVSKVISGGPMMGFAMYDTHVPCIKTSSACLCLEKDDVADAEQTACINCGRCVGVCPGHVIPARLATFAEHGDMESFQKFDGMDKYFTPFVSPTSNHDFKSRAKKDVIPEHNQGIPVVPQILSNRSDEFVYTASRLIEYGYHEINLNLGCPSGTVVSKGRGSGFLAKPEELDRFLDDIFSQCEVPISVKTRLGRYSPDEFPDLLEIYNRYPIRELTIHPRIRDDYYKNTPNLDMFEYAVEHSKNPLCYNGDITTVEEYERFCERFPTIEAIMIGRGLIANPGLVREIQTGEKMQKEELHVFLRELKVAYQACMPDQPVLFKMKEIWSYLVNWYPNGKKVWKKVRKTNRLIEYDKLMLMLESGNEV